MLGQATMPRIEAYGLLLSPRRLDCQLSNNPALFGFCAAFLYHVLRPPPPYVSSFYLPDARCYKGIRATQATEEDVFALRGSAGRNTRYKVRSTLQNKESRDTAYRVDQQGQRSMASYQSIDRLFTPFYRVYDKNTLLTLHYDVEIAARRTGLTRSCLIDRTITLIFFFGPGRHVVFWGRSFAGRLTPHNAEKAL